ncbi:hypothetical protein U1Q18_024868, partial [Sarracenia purpurea var. burkii]
HIAPGSSFRSVVRCALSSLWLADLVRFRGFWLRPSPASVSLMGRYSVSGQPRFWSCVLGSSSSQWRFSVAFVPVRWPASSFFVWLGLFCPLFFPSDTSLLCITVGWECSWDPYPHSAVLFLFAKEFI